MLPCDSKYLCKTFAEKYLDIITHKSQLNGLKGFKKMDKHVSQYMTPFFNKFN